MKVSDESKPLAGSVSFFIYWVDAEDQAGALDVLVTLVCVDDSDIEISSREPVVVATVCVKRPGMNANRAFARLARFFDNGFLLISDLGAKCLRDNRVDIPGCVLTNW